MTTADVIDRRRLSPIERMPARSRAPVRSFRAHKGKAAAAPVSRRSRSQRRKPAMRGSRATRRPFRAGNRCETVPLPGCERARRHGCILHPCQDATIWALAVFPEGVLSGRSQIDQREFGRQSLRQSGSRSRNPVRFGLSLVFVREMIIRPMIHMTKPTATAIQPTAIDPPGRGTQLPHWFEIEP